MTSEITVPRRQGPAVEPDDVELTHVVCCDPDVALCGMDVSGFAYCPDEEPVTCPMCALIDPDAPCPKCPDYSPPEVFR